MVGFLKKILQHPFAPTLPRRACTRVSPFGVTSEIQLCHIQLFKCSLVLFITQLYNTLLCMQCEKLHLANYGFRTRMSQKMNNPFLRAGLQNPIVSMYRAGVNKKPKKFKTVWHGFRGILKLSGRVNQASLKLPAGFSNTVC